MNSKPARKPAWTNSKNFSRSISSFGSYISQPSHGSTRSSRGPLELRPGTVADIHVEVGCQLDELAALLWLLGMDEDDVDIGRATQRWVCIGGKRACQVCGDDVAVVKSALLDSLFCNSDQ